MKYALVTGSTKGIGLAIAQKLSHAGYFVFTNGRSDNPKIDMPSDCHYYVKADLSALEGVETLANTVLSKTQKLDCLILNAGTTCRKALLEIGYTEWQQVMDTNVNMPFFLVQRLFNNIADNGSVVFISSATSLKPHATSVPYGVSKAAVNMLAQNLVKDFAPRGIRTNVICPGFIETEWQTSKSNEHRQSITSKIALERFGTPKDIAEFCYSTIENEYINGAVIPVDGGYDFK